MGKRLPHPLDSALIPALLPVLRRLTIVRGLLDRLAKAPQNARLKNRLTQEERALARTLAHPIAIKKTTPPGIIRTAFAKALAATRLYPQTVGCAHNLLSSCAIKTLPLFSPETQLMPTETQIHPSALPAYRQGKKNLVLKTRVVTALRAQLKQHADGRVTTASAFALFHKLFPQHPFQLGDIDVVATETALYFGLPGRTHIRDTHAPRNRKAALKFLKDTANFRSIYLKNFPMFSLFDARDVDTNFRDQLADRAGIDRDTFSRTLNHVVMVLPTADFEKYLIHDSWGHVWQADLTDLARNYDVTASFLHPLAPDDSVSIRGRLRSFIDCCHITPDGKLILDAAMTQDFITAYHETRVKHLLGLVIAEMTADIVEYKFLIDRPECARHMPSSSHFKEHAAKLDLAFADFKFLLRLVRDANASYLKNARLLENFTQHFMLRLKDLYPERFPSTNRQPRFKRACKAAVRNFLSDLARAHHQAFNHRLQARKTKNGLTINAFTRLFLADLRTQFTVNSLFTHRDAQVRSAMQKNVPLLILFLAFVFENDASSFWSLNRILAQEFLPLLRQHGALV